MQLALPAGLPAGAYTIAVGLGATSEELAITPSIVGKFELAHPIAQNASPQHALAARFDQQIQFVGFDIHPETTPVQAPNQILTTVEAGNTLDLTLYWQAAAPAAESYHGFTHLVDDNGTPLLKVDQVPGPELSPATTWLPGRTYPDTYRLNLPEDSASGLYWPLVASIPLRTVNCCQFTRANLLHLSTSCGSHRSRS
ncbi:MAG: hypothetical protein IPK16_21600 [Anaerolineales bacterium]|nr:hypothetical protein [Anaerolineales bacterium]